jgi:hypothetical protein
VPPLAAKIASLLLSFTSCSYFARLLLTWKRQFFVTLEQARQVIKRVKEELLLLVGERNSSLPVNQSMSSLSIGCPPWGVSQQWQGTQ